MTFYCILFFLFVRSSEVGKSIICTFVYKASAQSIFEKHQFFLSFVSYTERLLHCFVGQRDPRAESQMRTAESTRGSTSGLYFVPVAFL
jgi:hypothetical protein